MAHYPSNGVLRAANFLSLHVSCQAYLDALKINIRTPAERFVQRSVFEQHEAEIIRLLQALNYIDSDNAYIEDGCEEHDVIHVTFNTFVGWVPVHYITIDLHGNITKD